MGGGEGKCVWRVFGVWKVPRGLHWFATVPSGLACHPACFGSQCHGPADLGALSRGGYVEIEEFFLGCIRFSGHARAMDVGKIIQAVDHVPVWSPF